MGSLAESSSLQTQNDNPLLLLPCACSPLLPVKLKQVLMLVFSMVTMDTDTILPTMVTMDTLMPTIMDITMARGLLMPSLKLLLMLASITVTMDTDMLLAMPTMVTMDTHMPTTMDISMARGLLMPNLRLLLLVSIWSLWIRTPSWLCPSWILWIPICPPLW